MSLPEEALAIIKEEEKILAEVLCSLQSQYSASQKRLGTESVRARELTSELVATRRAEDKAMLASDEAVSHALTHKKKSDIKQLDKLLIRPYFGRIVLEEERGNSIKTIEYKIGISANPDCRIIDWRKAPISKLFYEYKQGDTYEEEIQGVERIGTVMTRRTVDIQNGELRGLTCHLGSFEKSGAEWTQRSGSGGPGLKAGGLTEILPLITPEQFRTITEDAESAVLIQGVAGSGKTTVALHRMAWLLHQRSEEFTPAKCGIIMRSRALKRFSESVLPSLGVEGVLLYTIDEWAARSIQAVLPHLTNADGTIRRPDSPAPSSVERVKRSLALLEHLEEFTEKFRVRISTTLDQLLPWDQIPSGIRSVFDNAVGTRTPVGALMHTVRSALNTALRTVSGATERYPALYSAQATLDEFERSEIKLERLLIALYDNYQAIIDHDKTRLLDREIIGWSRARTELTLSSQTLDSADDGIALRMIQLLYGGPLTKDGSIEKLQHLVVDEVQDLSPVELAASFASVKDPAQLTLVGDANQRMDEESSFVGWEILRERWSLQDSSARFVTLTVSHRSTLPIMRFAAHVQGNHPPAEGRSGRVPIWFKCANEDLGITSALDWLGRAIEKYPDAMTAILCSTPQEAKQVLSLLRPTFGSAVRLGDDYSFSFEEGLIVTDVQQVKGLEFCNVLIWNPDKRTYTSSQKSRNKLYVAATRAIENLCTVSWTSMPDYFPKPNSKLIRLYEIQPEPEEEEPSAELDRIPS